MLASSGAHLNTLMFPLLIFLPYRGASLILYPLSYQALFPLRTHTADLNSSSRGAANLLQMLRGSKTPAKMYLSVGFQNIG